MIPYLDDSQIDDFLQFPELISRIHHAFCNKFEAPERIKIKYGTSNSNKENTLLLMPAWSGNNAMGIKLVTVTPDNNMNNLAAIQGIYILFSPWNGKPLLMLDAKKMTSKRTAACSALASRYLSRKDAKSLLMIGTGSLAPELIKAHASVRPIEKVFVWGRDFNKANELAAKIDFLKAIPTAKISDVIGKVDIISCATLSTKPLIFGENLISGQHIDLVGAYLPDTREADDLAIIKSSVYFDVPHALKECGELKIPLENGTLKREDIKKDLFELCKENTFQRISDQEITMFKSTGHALEDLATALLIKEKYENGQI